MYNRVIWIILDSVGIGELPDADKFGDKGADTLGNIFKEMNREGNFDLLNLRTLGLGNIDNISNIKNIENPIGVYCKAKEISNGKDTTIGHWEMCGIYTKEPFPTYPDGFPKEVVDKFVEKAGIPGILANRVASGTEVLEQLGEEHMATRKPIIYTSSDSVFQIACHEDIYSNEELYKMCKVAREILTGKNAVARVIARPFAGDTGNFERTSARRDFSLKPDEDNLLVKLTDKGISVNAIGKIEDIFTGFGITNAVHTKDNLDGIQQIQNFMDEYQSGLIFANLVEFDSKWGHRRDVKGYAQGLREFDLKLPDIIAKMKETDLLIINSDHGCDPTFKGTDHTREYIPVLIYSKNIQSENANVRDTFADIGQTIGKIFNVQLSIGKSII